MQNPQKAALSDEPIGALRGIFAIFSFVNMAVISKPYTGFGHNMVV
jgi:hypothetical protein